MPRRSDRTPRPSSQSSDRVAHAGVGSTDVRIVDHVEILVGAAGSDAAPVSSATFGRFASKVRQLPTFARTYSSHEAATLGSPNNALDRIMRLLDGKFVVANRPYSATLPSSVRDVMVEIEVLCRLSAGARRISVSLAEPAKVRIGHAARGGVILDETSRPRFFATLPYQLTIDIGADSSANARRLLDAALAVSGRLAAEPTEWFNVALCIPDGEAIQQMSGDVSHFYRGITGRLGAGTPERYWHLDAWEQYTEPGRVHGFIVPDLLRLPQHSAWSLPQEAESVDASSTYGNSLWPRLTSRLLKRGALIPPGYCLVEFWAQLSVDVCTIDHDGSRTGPREPVPRR